MFVSIQDWTYMLTNDGNGRFTLWHHVTPADGGYGTEVKETFKIGHYSKDTVGQLYHYIASLHMSPSEAYYDQKREVEALTNAMESLGLLV